MFEKRTFIIGIACLLTAASQAAVAQTAEAPGSKPPAPQQAAMQHNRGPKTVTLNNADGADIKLWLPDLSTLPVEAPMDQITLPSTGVDNYHALVATKNWGPEVEVVTRYEYLRGKPNGHSPLELVNAIKSELEVVPSPLPRDHYRYHSNQNWGFLVRYHGQPLPKIELQMETTNGSTLSSVTNEKGIAYFTLPDDFPDVVEGERDKRRADFSITATHQTSDVKYMTQLSAEYAINPSHWKSTGLGVTVAGIGLLIGGFIGRIGLKKPVKKSRG
ncbi:MAG: hypothetical protein GY934_11245 [Gammaproteobacteria bacterium]|nr:hypothetical protein [Gammaproteobacteria bacterium]